LRDKNAAAEYQSADSKRDVRGRDDRHRVLTKPADRAAAD
jgi:hypothetical protein